MEQAMNAAACHASALWDDERCNVAQLQGGRQRPQHMGGCAMTMTRVCSAGGGLQGGRERMCVVSIRRKRNQNPSSTVEPDTM